MLHDYLFVTVIPQIGKQSKVVPMHDLKAQGGVEVQLHLFLPSALNGGEWSASSHSHFTPVKQFLVTIQ
jgi:hypothetical protein